MYNRQDRSGRPKGSLYQAEYHRKLQARRLEQRARRRPRLTPEELRQRAVEARGHDCDYTHLFPETLLELLQIRERLALVEEILDLHWKMAQEEPDAHAKRDHMLWTQTISEHRRRE